MTTNFKFCPNCGTKLESGSNFCSECGYSLTGVTDNKTQNFTAAEPFNESENPGLITSTKLLIKDAFTLNKRMGRADYWWGILGITLLYAAASIIYAVMLAPLKYQVATVTHIWELLFSLFYALSLIAGFSAEIRRFHDINVTPWTLLFVLIPLIGFFVVLYFLAAKSKNIANPYPTTNPKEWWHWTPAWLILGAVTLLLIFYVAREGGAINWGGGCYNVFAPYE